MPRAKEAGFPSLPPIVSSLGLSTARAVLAQTEEATFDTRNKIERHRYAKLLLEYAERYRQFSSVSFFVETMLRELAKREDVTNQLRAMAAVWSMKLLSCQSPFKEFMAPLTDALLPAIYCNYDEKRLDYAPAAIQALLCDRALHRDNPFLSHTTYVHEYNVGLLKLKNVSEELGRVSRVSSGWKHFARMLVIYIQGERKRRAFVAWRNTVRKQRVIDKLRHKVVHRHDVDNRLLFVRLGFLRWKNITAMSRVEFLTERLHDAAFQLESAKNQFHIECFRADKLQVSNEEKDLQLKEVISERDELRSEVERLKEQLMIQEQIHAGNVKNRVLEVLTLAQYQNRLLKKAVGTRFNAREIVADWFQTEGDSFHVKEREQAENEMRRGHRFLLRWCNHILCVQEVTVQKKLRNFAEDFANGEVLYHIFRYVFPEREELQLPVDTIAGRLRVVCDTAASIPLTPPLTVEDFTMKREDKIVVAVAGVFAHYVERKRMDGATEAFRSVVEQDPLVVGADSDCDLEDVSTLKTEEDIKRQLSKWSRDLDEQMEVLRLGVLCEMSLQTCSMHISKEGSRLSWERSRGHPRQAVTSDSILPFVTISAKRMNDLCRACGSYTAQTWKPVADSLKGLLWSNVDTITSIFYYYAGESASEMDEVQFWRFVEESRLTVEPLSRETIARIFDAVISPKLVAMLQLKSAEKQAALLEAAEDEMNIRRVKPAQFTEILLRMGTVRFRDSLLEATGRFLTGLNLPTLCGAISTTREFYLPESQRVIRYLQEDLARIYFFYVKQRGEGPKGVLKGSEPQPARFVSRISLAAYSRMFTDCGFVAENKEKEVNVEKGDGGSRRYCRMVEFIDNEEITHIFNVLHERVLLLPEGELCFSLFLESFGIACQYWCPDPSIDFSRKLACFLMDMIEKLRTLHSRTALILRELQPLAIDSGRSDVTPW